MCEINFYLYVRLHVCAGIMCADSICLCFESVNIICIYASGQCYSQYMSSSLCARVWSCIDIIGRTHWRFIP